MRAGTRGPPEIVGLGADAGPRHDSLVSACLERFGVRPRTMSWAKFLQAPERLATALRARCYLRFDTPDQDHASLSALYAAGEAAAAAAGVETLSAHGCERLRDGDIGSPTQLWFGLVAAVSTAANAAQIRGAQISVAPGELASAFDKTDCLRRLRAAGVATPRVLPEVNSFDQLAAAMKAASVSRVFVKLRHGSAAAGMVALARHGDQWLAITTAAEGDADRVYATRDVRRLTDWRDIARLIDRLARLGLHVETWLPKIGVDGQIVDLRLIMVGEELVFPVLRSSKHPMTNLHLGGSRSAPDALVAHIGVGAWRDVLRIAAAARREYSSAHALGIDVAILAGGRRHAIIEVNVFGDFVKDVAVNGLNPHQAQVRQIEALMGTRRAADMGALP